MSDPSSLRSFRWLIPIYDNLRDSEQLLPPSSTSSPEEQNRKRSQERIEDLGVPLCDGVCIYLSLGLLLLLVSVWNLDLVSAIDVLVQLDELNQPIYEESIYLKIIS
ncbi:unnamed protein product [Cuscuta campestris]|uniref:Uncharacterized protein n=1 Tax=Cuscuta campestris TaxID=132261 RepID=A0A484LUW5_9ASTE|nr:unnamed protein product [Cuscuta campestris]